jgi:Tfp pilus assembly protein PilF
MNHHSWWCLTLLLVWISVAWPFRNTALERGLEAFRKRDLPAALQAFQEAVRAEPSNARALRFLGMVYMGEEDYDDAEEPLARACSLDPHEPDACYYLGRTCYRLGRFEESRKAYEIALEDSSERSAVLHGLALTLDAAGDAAAAERYYRQAIEAHRQAASVDYGLFLFKQGRTAESLEILRKAGAKDAIDRVTRALANVPRGGTRSAPLPVRFEEQTLDMVVENGAVGQKHQIETMIAGAAVFDYDNDGWPDIFISNGADVASLVKTGSSFQNRLFRNNRDGTFTDVTKRAGLAGAGYSMGVAAADYDNDGWEDLFVTGVRGNALYHNRGDGTFEDVTARSGLERDHQWTVAAGWFDYDNDARLDLFVVRYVVWDPAIEPYCGLFKPGYRLYCHPKQYGALANALYHNEGHGLFRDVSVESGIAAHPGKGMGVAFGDYDGDGRMDIFVANDTVPNYLFHNDGHGKFTEVGLQAGVAYNDDGRATSSMGVDFRDYDNDGSEDLLITAMSQESFTLFRNTGRGTFADMSAPSRLGIESRPWSGWSAGMFDLNNDGWKDVFTANGHVQDNAELTSSWRSKQSNTVFLNRGDGTFEAQVLPGEAFHRGAAFGDFDRDGRMDVLVTSLNGKPQVLRNRTPNVGHWLEIRLTGTRSNRDGIGARIHILTRAGEQWNRVTTSVGYGCSSDRVVHFGLGAEIRVQDIDVNWPSGVLQNLKGIDGDQILQIVEP